MTAVIWSALGLGAGLAGMFAGMRRRPPNLLRMLAQLRNPTDAAQPSASDVLRNDRWRVDRRIGWKLAGAARQHPWCVHTLGTRLALVGTSWEVLCSQSVLSAVAGLVLPTCSWAVVRAGGLHVAWPVPLWAGLVLGAAGASLPVLVLDAQSTTALGHARRAVCSFLDLVVLGLAAGMGIESALFTAAQIGESPFARRMYGVLTICRATGEPPWDALARLGAALGVEELCEVASTASVAGLEGARVRQTLAARAATMRRHELAQAESDANAVTEKLFLPGAFLLVGFLLFIGYPAFARITTGL